MLRIQSFTVLCVVTFLVIVAAIVAHEDTGAIPRSGEPLFPDLMSAINDVESVRASSRGKSFTLERRSGAWVVADRFGYPANADKVHSLLVGAAGLRRIEPKTKKPELYSKLGLAEGDSDTGQAVSFELESAGGKTIASWISGNAAPSKGDPEASEIYVRLSDDPQAWLVEGKVPRDGALVDWLDQSILDIERNRVRQVHVLHADGEEVVVSKETFEGNDFSLGEMPEDMDVNGQWRINDIGRAFSNLELAEVQPRNALPADASPFLTVTMRTFDGLEIKLYLYKLDGKPASVLSARFDQSLRHAGEAKIPAEKVREEASALQGKLARWVYILPEFKADHLAQKRETLLKQRDAKESQSGQG